MARLILLDDATAAPAAGGVVNGHRVAETERSAGGRVAGAGGGVAAGKSSVLQLMREDPELCLLSVEDRLEVAMEFLFTGTTSVTSSISWLLYHVAGKAAHQDAVRQEAHSVFASALRGGGGRGEVPMCHGGVLGRLGQLNYLDACLRETLRLYSPIHIGRICYQDDVAGGYHIPAGADVMTNMWWIHRHPANWAEPDEFKPERFLDAAGQGSKAPHYYPFSMGVRGCPGQAVAFMISKLVASRVFAFLRLTHATVGDVPFKPNLMLPNTPQGMLMHIETFHEVATN